MCTHPPPLGAFLGELGEVDGDLRSFAFVLVSASLHKKGVRRRLALGLIHVSFDHGCESVRRKRVQVAVMCEITVCSHTVTCYGSTDFIQFNVHITSVEPQKLREQWLAL